MSELREQLHASVAQENTSGMQPLDLRVLVLPDSAQDKVGSIFLPPSEVDKEEMAMTFGTMIAAGVNAWEEAAKRSTAFIRPVPGDRVIFAKYGGILIKGKDGVKYRLMNDEDILGLEA